MMRFLGGMAFFDPAAVPDGVTYVSGFKVLEADGLTGLLRSIRDTISGRKASVLVIDGLVSLGEAATSSKFRGAAQTRGTRTGSRRTSTDSCRSRSPSRI